jgi:hypothetical protein
LPGVTAENWLARTAVYAVTVDVQLLIAGARRDGDLAVEHAGDDWDCGWDVSDRPRLLRSGACAALPGLNGLGWPK